MTKNEERINKLFKELVPETGKADSLAGELVRAMSRIGYRFYNDGDQLGIGSATARKPATLQGGSLESRATTKSQS